MPIRINLLAESIAAEEERRRDPVKRAAVVGGLLITFVFGWAGLLQMEIGQIRRELAYHEDRLQTVENGSKETMTSNLKNREIELRIASLQKYATNRFFWSTALDAVQKTLVDNVRVVSLQSQHNYATNAESRFKTNKVLPLPKSSRWQLWGGDERKTNVLEFIENQIASITNRAEYVTNRVKALAPKVEIVTNKTSVSTLVEIIRPAAMTEQIVMTIKARDYGNPPGKQVDEFFKAIGQQPYFRENLFKNEGQGLWLRERAIQPKINPDDPLDPGMPYIPFTVECRYQDKVRSNE